MSEKSERPKNAEPNYANPNVAKRFATNETARIEFYGKKDILFCRMNNLSSSGAFFEIINSTSLPRAGDLVRVHVHLRQINKSYVVNGEIIWIKGFGLGIAFIKQEEIFRRFMK